MLISDWGAANANSYIGLTEANSFITTSIIDSTAWTSATSMAQQAALLEATRDVDSRQYIGGPYFREQNLEFPRALPTAFPWAFTEVSSMLYSVEQRKMKEDVERATCVQALWLLRLNGRNIHAENQAFGIESYSETTGPITDSVRYRKGAGVVGNLAPEALKYLSDWLTGRRVVRQ